ncbi:MAG TPA: glycosyltransferase [Rubricoccaceae bacterium]|nr:glycosyltransferase [Rubricoccaceae bacterium]
MPYALFDLEATLALPPLTLTGEEAGLAVLVRHEGRPVAFWMEPLYPGAHLTTDDVARRVEAHAGPKLLRERLRAALAPAAARPAETPPLPPLTVAVCTRDRPELVARCLDALAALDAGDAGLPEPPEILAVDNAPSDGRTREVVAGRPGVRYVCEPRAGLDFARNRALAEARGDLVAFLDDDVVVDRFWLAGLAEAYAENPDAAAFTGLVLPYELETEAQVLFERRGGFRRGFEKLRYQGPERAGNPLYPCGAGVFGAGANMAFRRDVLLALGGFDEALDTGAPLPGGGDLDAFYRVVRAGYPLVYEPRYLAFHQHRRDVDGLRRQYRSWGLGLMAFVGKTYGADPAQRPKLRRLVRWWLRYQLGLLWAGLRGGDALPPRMVWAELAGGVAGLLGEYGRSARRVRRIREQAERGAGAARPVPAWTGAP